MKKSIAFIALLVTFLASATATAQAYRPMLVDSVRWIVRYDEIDYFLPVKRWEYYALGDTLVEGKEYKRIYLRYLETNQSPPFEPTSPYILAALMREDTIARQVFGIPLQLDYLQTSCPEKEETLLYDFDLMIGDTVNHLCIVPDTDFCGETYIVSAGNGFFYGINTKYFEVEGGCTYGSFYEGLGSDYGLFEEMFTPVKSSAPWSVRLEYYCPTSDCPFVVGTTETAEPQVLVVYPNPASSWVAFDFTLPVHVNEAILQITDAQGRNVVSFTLKVKQGQQLWDIREVKKGTYFYNLKANGQSKNGKLIIN
jgi:hypothetical protein